MVIVLQFCNQIFFTFPKITAITNVGLNNCTLTVSVSITPDYLKSIMILHNIINYETCPIISHQTNICIGNRDIY